MINCISIYFIIESCILITYFVIKHTLSEARTTYINKVVLTDRNRGTVKHMRKTRFAQTAKIYIYERLEAPYICCCTVEWSPSTLIFCIHLALRDIRSVYGNIVGQQLVIVHVYFMFLLIVNINIYYSNIDIYINLNLLFLVQIILFEQCHWLFIFIYFSLMIRTLDVALNKINIIIIIMYTVGLVMCWIIIYFFLHGNSHILKNVI